LRESTHLLAFRENFHRYDPWQRVVEFE